MRFIKLTALGSIALAFLLAFGVNSDTFAQGRSGGGMGRPTTSPGVDRGIDTSAASSNGRSAQGRSTASDNSNGRYDTGIEHARMMRENNSREANREIERNPQMGEKLHMNANDLRSGYQTALATNPDLKFGQYVAANMITRNLGSRNSNITADAILSRLASGDSIGQALRDLGVSKDEAKRAEKEAKRRMKAAQDRD